MYRLVDFALAVAWCLIAGVVVASFFAFISGVAGAC